MTMSVNKKILNIGLIGAGSSATNIATTIATIKDLKLVAVCDINEDAAQKIAIQHNVSFVTTDYKELCNRDDLDFVVISLLHGLHKEVAMECFESGKHVLVEKPIATTVDDAKAMIALAQEKDLKLGVHFQNRFIDSVQEAKKIIDATNIG